MGRTAFTVLLMVSLPGTAACGDDKGDEGGTTVEEIEGELTRAAPSGTTCHSASETGFQAT